jgi:hypothetical protein
MINKSGYTGVNKNSSPPISTSKKKEGESSLRENLFFGVVKDIELNSTNYGNLGLVTFTDYNGVEIGKARPLSSNINIYPNKGEVIIIFYTPDQIDDNLNTNYFYLSPLNIIKNPNNNSIQLPAINSTQLSSFSSLLPINPLYVKNNIHPLHPYISDVIIEGRFGNSLRFGSTNRNTDFPNMWSMSGDEYSPITILTNGQNPLNPELGYVPTVEDITQDLSSIYLTSTQKIPFSIANENFISYTTPPITPSQYINPQIISNSDRIIINAKKDSVLISGEKSVGISSNESINIESTSEINIASKQIKLGDKNANQSVLRGDETVEYLKILITELQNISEALKVIQDWPSGAPTPNPVILTTANSALQVFTNVYNQIDSIKSKIVKTV